MPFPTQLPLSSKDAVNDRIWHHLHMRDYNALDVLNPERFSIDKIRNEIRTGCSPCPDVLTGEFGDRPSVVFVSTVYGLIHKYLGDTYDRSRDNWPVFIERFFSLIVQTGTGIYGRLSNVYRLVSENWEPQPEFCLTELVKTVLVDHKNRVSGLESCKRMG